ncbi:MAG: bacterial proteasome activator family protein [Rhodococcus sp.]|uniref:bacterial proteasome activator family protein n=1 Tax=Rhodococcus TaxID=1827 RepID=UPI0016B3B10E|nr:MULTISPECIES: bacterial proteasome activator family protein [Rhodococcus]NLV80178.1 bacterial proteasome activator family protein [Rhodococcus sp. (in: high G+C Gram-positive bacteria)]
MTHPDNDAVLVIGPDGRPIRVPRTSDVPGTSDEATPDTNEENTANADDSTPGETLADMVEQPAKVMRIGTMIKQLLEEVKAAPLDDASRTRLKEIHRSSVVELEQGLAPELREELERLALPFSEDAVPSDAELRIAQAQLVGWLEGLFHGIQTALFAQQMAARAQLEQMRQGALPPGLAVQMQQPGDQHGHGNPGTGQYL